MSPNYAGNYFEAAEGDQDERERTVTRQIQAARYKAARTARSAGRSGRTGRETGPGHTA